MILGCDEVLTSGSPFSIHMGIRIVPLGRNTSIK